MTSGVGGGRRWWPRHRESAVGGEGGGGGRERGGKESPTGAPRSDAGQAARHPTKRVSSSSTRRQARGAQPTAVASAVGWCKGAQASGARDRPRQGVLAPNSCYPDAAHGHTTARASREEKNKKKAIHGHDHAASDTATFPARRACQPPPPSVAAASRPVGQGPPRQYATMEEAHVCQRGQTDAARADQRQNTQIGRAHV